MNSVDFKSPTSSHPSEKGARPSQNDHFKFETGKNELFTEVETHVNNLRSLPCPICKSEESDLNGTVIHKVRSFIWYSNTDTEFLVGCPDCLNKINRKEIILGSLLGWWGPKGIVQTPKALRENLRSRKSHKSKVPNGALKTYVKNNIELLEEQKKRTENLMKIVMRMKMV